MKTKTSGWTTKTRTTTTLSRIAAVVALALMLVPALILGCAATVQPMMTLRATPEVLASSIRVVTSWSGTTGLADSVILTHFVGSYPGSPDSVRKAYPVGPARADTQSFAPPQGYSVTGIVFARLKRGAAVGPRDSATWASSLPLTNRVPAFAVRADTLP